MYSTLCSTQLIALCHLTWQITLLLERDGQNEIMACRGNQRAAHLPFSCHAQCASRTTTWPELLQAS